MTLYFPGSIAGVGDRLGTYFIQFIFVTFPTPRWLHRKRVVLLRS